MPATLDRFQSIDPALLDIREEHRVIDLGCGTGRHVLELSRGRGDIIGADVSRGDLLKARYILEIMRRDGEVSARVHWLQTAGERLPFSDHAFDRVICTETLEHVDDDRVLARELVRVLKPGGILAVSVPDEYSESVFWRLSKNYRTHAGGHVRIYARRRIVALMREAGLRPYAVRYRHALETAYWLSHIAFWSDWGKQGPITGAFRRLLDSPRTRRSPIASLLDDVGNRILPKSIVVYSRKPLGASPSANGAKHPPMTRVDAEPSEFGRPEHMPPELTPEANGHEEQDERTEVQVRAVPAPFEVAAPANAGEVGSLREEFRRALQLPGEAQKQRLIEILRSCRFALMREAQELSGEQAATPCTPDGRTMKEVVAHISAWELWTAAALGEITMGIAEPAIMTLGGYPEGIGRYASIDTFNAARMAEAREMPWAAILELSSQRFERLTAAAEGVPAEALRQTAPFYWPELGGTVPCGLYLLMVAAQHYQEEHLPEVRRG